MDKYTLAHEWLTVAWANSPAGFDNLRVVNPPDSHFALFESNITFEPVMFLDSNSFISRASRKLWLLPTFVIPTALGFCFIVEALFGSNLTELVVVLIVAQVIASIVVWKSWRGTQ